MLSVKNTLSTLVGILFVSSCETQAVVREIGSEVDRISCDEVILKEIYQKPKDFIDKRVCVIGEIDNAISDPGSLTILPDNYKLKNENDSFTVELEYGFIIFLIVPEYLMDRYLKMPMQSGIKVKAHGVFSYFPCTEEFICQYSEYGTIEIEYLEIL